MKLTSLIWNSTSQNSDIETHNNHPASDYIRDGYLKPECVEVRLSRVNAGVYDVKIGNLN